MIKEPDDAAISSGIYSSGSMPPARSGQEGVALSRLRAWHRCLLAGGDDAAREAALSSEPVDVPAAVVMPVILDTAATPRNRQTFVTIANDGGTVPLSVSYERPSERAARTGRSHPTTRST